MVDGESNPSNPGVFITEKFCNERFGRLLDKLDAIDDKLDKINNDKKSESHFWRNFLGTLAGGGLVAYFAWLLSTFAH